MAKLATAAAAGDELEQVTSVADSTFACPPFRSLIARHFPCRPFWLLLKFLSHSLIFPLFLDPERCHPTQPFRCPGETLTCISIQYLCGKYQLLLIEFDKNNIDSPRHKGLAVRGHSDNGGDSSVVRSVYWRSGPSRKANKRPTENGLWIIFVLFLKKS